MRRYTMLSTYYNHVLHVRDNQLFHYNISSITEPPGVVYFAYTTVTNDDEISQVVQSYWFINDFISGEKKILFYSALSIVF
jgi:hypothetical protein